MKRWFGLGLIVLVAFLTWPLTCPAPLVYQPGEGWTYESAGGGKWIRARAQDQYEVAKEAFDKKQYRLATKAARRTVSRWPLSDYAPQAQYLLGRCYEARHADEKAFKEYQKAVEKYPKVDDYEAILKHQYDIARRYLGGQWFKLWGYIPFFPSMEKTADMFGKIVKNGTFSSVAPQAQMDIGAAREKQKDYYLAVKAYEKAADVYHENKTIAAEAVYRAGLAYKKQAQTADYDQSAAASAIATFNDFMVLYPNDKRTAEAEKTISALKTEQARGAFQVAKFYEKRRRWAGALVYYNEAFSRDPESKYGIEAKQRIDILQRRVTGSLRPSPGTETSPTKPAVTSEKPDPAKAPPPPPSTNPKSPEK